MMLLTPSWNDYRLTCSLWILSLRIFCLRRSHNPRDQIRVPNYSSLEGFSKCTCQPLLVVNNNKYPGICINDHLDWRVHENVICGRIRRLMYLFKNLRRSADVKTLQMVYQTLCQSIITYCLSIWDGTSKTILIDLERTQRMILKSMFCKRRTKSFQMIILEI